MKLLFSFLRPQIVFGAGGRGGGGSVKRDPKGSGNGPTGFADQASRMSKSQRQLGAPQMPGLDFEADKDVPSVVSRKPQRDSSPIDAGSGGFMESFKKSPKSGNSTDYANPLTSGFGSRIEAGNSLQKSAQKSLDLSGIGGVADVKTPSFGDQGTSKPVGLPRSPEPPNGGRPTRPQPGAIFDDFIPRNSDGSPKYTAPDGSPLRRPYDPSTPARPTTPPGGGKGGSGALPPKRPPVRAPTPVTPMPTPRQPMPTPRQPMPTPFPDPRPKRPTSPISDPRLRDPIRQPVLYGGGKGGAGPRPSRPSVPVPPQEPMPVSRPVYKPRVSTPVQSPMPYGGKGGGARPSTQQRRPQMPFTYYRPKR